MKIPHPWRFDHDYVAWNDRLPNINAALGFAQMNVISSRLETKSKLFHDYYSNFLELADVSIIPPVADAISNHWLNSLIFSESLVSRSPHFLHTFVEKCHSIGLLVRPIWKPLSNLKMYKDSPQADLSNATSLSNRILSLPSSPQLIT